MVGKKGLDCTRTPQNFNIATRVLTWTPVQWNITLSQCFKDFESTCAIYSLDTGKDIADFTGKDVMGIIGDFLVTAMKKFIIRLAWFSDTAAKNVSDSGTIKNDVDVEYFNILDGLFKQIDVQCTANAKQKVTIAENAKATYAEQQLDKANIQGYLEKLYYNAPIKLKQMTGNVIYCTLSFYEAYQKSLQGTGLESLLMNMQNGMKTLSFNGIPLMPLPIWDELLLNFDTGTKLINPHRALFTNQEVLGMAVDNLNSFEDLDIWYSKETRKVNMDAAGKADVKLMNPELFVYAV